MPLTILTDAEVRELLLSLSKEDIIKLQENLMEALHEYSTGNQDTGCCSLYQPQRTAMTRPGGQTTLFMPASTSTSVGLKIVTLASPSSTSDTSSKASISSSSPAASTREASIGSATSEMSRLSTSTGSTSPSVQSLEGKDEIKTGSNVAEGSHVNTQGTTPRGTLTLLDGSGYPLGLVNAEELTAFRTALAATMLLKLRKHVHTMTVFGAGKQAFWHIKLAMMLRGSEIKHINVINRSFDRSRTMLREFLNEDWRAHTRTSILTPDYTEYSRVLKDEVRKADIIFCCTPSTEPLFPAEYLTSTEGRKKGRYISAIGSYKSHMVELHPDIIRQAVEPEHHRHHHKHADKGGVIIVDSLESCLKEAGEVIQAGLKPQHLVEIGELVMVKRAVAKEIELGGEGEKGLLDWLVKGNVIYKSVGLGLMDLVVGCDLVTLATERGVGTTVRDF